MFFYESLLTRALDGIDQTAIVAAILNVSCLFTASAGA